MPITSYRYPSEHFILALTVLALMVLLGLTAGATLCLAPLFVVVFLVLTYQTSRASHNNLLLKGTVFSPQNTPALDMVAQNCMRRLRLQPGDVRFFLIRNRERNAYTFGLDKPSAVVIYSGLMEDFDTDELHFVIGHELGHVALGHSWLNSLLGGMAGIPTTLEAAVLLTLAFRWWNRACEYSADRAGLLACGSPQKATTALIKLVAGDARSAAELQRALVLIEQEDNSPVNVLAESFSTHPMIVRRIEELKKYAASAKYRRLAGEIR